jgi:D-glycero-alpha-D-manno-heptose-7-phosphate kinase
VIISKTPYRIPLTGGGTDIDFYYKKKTGHICSVAINQYVYVLLRERDIDNNYLIQTTSTEFKNKIDDIRHKLIKETLKFFKVTEKVHVGTYSTVPTKTGLGTSSAMVVGLINCINKYKKLKLSNKQIYKYAYIIERKICNYHGGWQDQIVSQYGGFVEIKINKKEKIIVKKFKKNTKLNNIIKKNFVLVYSKQKRDSSKVILSQKKKANSIIQYYDKIKSLNKEFLKNLNDGNIDKIGKIFDFHWNLKKKLSDNITNKKLNLFYKYLIENFEFSGGKLIGAGGGGFFLMSLKNQKKVINELKLQNINYIKLDVENKGSHIIEN